MVIWLSLCYIHVNWPNKKTSFQKLSPRLYDISLSSFLYNETGFISIFLMTKVMYMYVSCSFISKHFFAIYCLPKPGSVNEAYWEADLAILFAHVGSLLCVIEYSCFVIHCISARVSTSKTSIKRLNTSLIEIKAKRRMNGLSINKFTRIKRKTWWRHKQYSYKEIQRSSNGKGFWVYYVFVLGETEWNYGLYVNVKVLINHPSNETDEIGVWYT